MDVRKAGFSEIGLPAWTILGNRISGHSRAPVVLKGLTGRLMGLELASRLHVFLSHRLEGREAARGLFVLEAKGMFVLSISGWRYAMNEA